MKDGTLVLYDPTNPVALGIDDSVGYIPAYSIIGPMDIHSLESVAFDFENLSKIYKQPIHPDEKLYRNYITCNYYLKQQETQLKN